MKKLIFISEFLNHYELPLYREFINIYGEDYVFIAISPIPRVIMRLGYKDFNRGPFVLRAYESPDSMQQAQKLIDEAECVISGVRPLKIISSRLKLGKMTFMDSERLFSGFLKEDLRRFVKYCIYKGGRRAARDKDSKFYLLCEGAFTDWDYNFCGLFKHKAYRWGRFPECKQYDDIDKLISLKKPASILWRGIFEDWRHPELAIKLAKNLRDSNINFSLKIIGIGIMPEKIQNMINELNLNDCITISSVSIFPEEIRREMESSQIVLFTSDRAEGWGTGFNEAMNSACAVVAGEKIGAVPFLIQDNQNGLIFRNKDINDLTRKVKSLLENPSRIPELGRAAYDSITSLWNAKTAAKRFIELSEALRESSGPVNLFSEGPCSYL